MNIPSLLPVLFLIPLSTQAQEKSKHSFGDRLLLGANYGFTEDYVGDRSNLYEAQHFVMARAGVSITRHLYAGIQSRFIRARNFETPAQNFYMGGAWVRAYLLHPVPPKASTRVGVFLESGFMVGNYAFSNSNNAVTYPFERPGSWYLPLTLGLEFRIWRHLTLEGGMNVYYNNGGSWDDQGIAHMSLGANWHW